MATKKNISIDIEINADSQQQLDRYKQAFDNLRTSINSLSDPISKLDDGIDKLSTSVKELNSESDPVSSTLSKIKKASEDTEPVVKGLKAAYELLTKGALSLEAALTGGLTILLALAPQIFELITSLTKGKEVVDKAALSLNNMNSALQSSSYSNAIKQFNELKINVGLAKKGFLDKKEVLDQYNTTIGKTMGQVSDFNDIEAKITKNGSAYIKMTLLKASAQLALQEAAKKTYEIEQTQIKSDDDVLNLWDKTKDFLRRGFLTVVEGPVGLADANIETDKIATATKRRAETITELTKQKNAFLSHFSEQQKEAAEIAKTSGLDFFENAPTIQKPKPKLEHPPIDTSYIEALSSNFAKGVEITNQGYEADLAALKSQLGKKLITQQQYEEQSKVLQEKYHQSLGQNIEKFFGTDYENVKKHLQDLSEQAHLAEAINSDQEKVKKAILPGDKLAADKQLITDKYDLEISLAKGNADKIKQLEQSKQQDITELNKRFAQERKDFELKTTQEVSNAAFSMLQNSIKSQSEAKIKQLETQKTSELNNSSLTSSQKKAIEEKYAKKEAEEKTKAFKAEQKASILQAVINGALAITKVTAQTGVASAFIIPGIIAETAIQVATIAAQKAPQYAKGGVHYQSDGRGALLPGYSRTDNMNAYLRSGEAVVVSEAMRDPWARNLVSAINVAYGGRDFSMPNPHRGYAIGGIFTDGGNSNRYYNAPMNDQKDLANTIAYQMINNFPPVYVDVKDINTQQSILAQTINRVNL